jgi:NAD-dependent deacetylase
VLAEWSARFPKFRLITQNVDGLHERAFATATARPAGPADVIRLHGSIWEVSCWSGCARSPKRWRDDTVSFKELPPRCPHCQGLIRPGVVWFGETLETNVISQAWNAANCDVFITIGTSAVVYPAAGFIDQARKQGAFTVEINPEATPATATVDLAITGGAETVLPEIDRSLRG